MTVFNLFYLKKKKATDSNGLTCIYCNLRVTGGMVANLQSQKKLLNKKQMKMKREQGLMVVVRLVGLTFHVANWNWSKTKFATKYQKLPKFMYYAFLPISTHLTL